MVTLMLPTLRGGQAAGFVLTTALPRTGGSGGRTGGIRRREGLAAATPGHHVLVYTPGLNGRCLARVVTRETVGPDFHLF